MMAPYACDVILYILVGLLSCLGMAIIVENPTNQTTCIGIPASFRCVNNDFVTIVWIVNNMSLGMLKLPFAATIPLPNNAGVESTLEIPGNLSFSGASVVCRYNQIHSAPAFLTILGPSSPPVLINIPHNTSSALLSWVFESVAFSAPLKYQVEIKNSIGSQVYNVTLSETQLVYTIPDPCDSYDAAVTAIYVYSSLTCTQRSSVQLAGGTCEITNVTTNVTLLPGPWEAHCSFISCAQSVGCLVFLNETFCTVSKRYMNSSSAVDCPPSYNNSLPGPGEYTIKAYAVLNNGSWKLDCVYTGVTVLTNEVMTASPMGVGDDGNTTTDVIVGAVIGSVLGIIIITITIFIIIFIIIIYKHKHKYTLANMELISAARIGDLATVKRLVATGVVNVNVTDENGVSPLWISSFKGHRDVVKILIQAGANLATEGIATPLYVASQNGHLTVVQTLLSAGADMNRATSDTNATPLYVASENGHHTVVQTLLEAHADVNIATSDMGETPLMKASSGGHDKCVELLLDIGANVDLQDMNRETALMKASETGNAVCVKMLMSAGVRVDMQDKVKTNPSTSASPFSKSSTGKRHMHTCRYYESDKPCSAEEGEPCKICCGGKKVQAPDAGSKLNEKDEVGRVISVCETECTDTLINESKGTPLNNPSMPAPHSLSSNGIRHYRNCHYYDSRKPCNADEGKPCRYCSGGDTTLIPPQPLFDSSP